MARLTIRTIRRREKQLCAEIARLQKRLENLRKLKAQRDKLTGWLT